MAKIGLQDKRKTEGSPSGLAANFRSLIATTFPSLLACVGVCLSWRAKRATCIKTSTRRNLKLLFYSIYCLKKVQTFLILFCDIINILNYDQNCHIYYVKLMQSGKLLFVNTNILFVNVHLRLIFIFWCAIMYISNLLFWSALWL